MLVYQRRQKTGRKHLAANCLSFPFIHESQPRTVRRHANES